MHILYLSEDYPVSRVHHNLCQGLAVQPDTQVTVFSIIRPHLIDKDIRSTYEHPNYQTITHNFSANPFLYKYFFSYKIRQKFAATSAAVDLSNINLTIAATLFSEGAIALKLYQTYHIPYIVAVRGSDINFYLKKMPHLFTLAKKILINARKIICISPKIYEELLTAYPLRTIRHHIESKTITITNGIDSLWIENSHIKTEHSDTHRVLYVGNFDKNKNVKRLIMACLQLRKDIPNICLHIIGGGGSQQKKILQLVAQCSDWIQYHGKIYDKQQLIELFRQNDIFAMISHSETFGLVYLEALTQGLPIVYTKGQGFDGIIHECVGYAADAHSTNNIRDALHSCFLQKEKLKNNLVDIDFSQFSWENIIKQWIEVIYQ